MTTILVIISKHCREYRYEEGTSVDLSRYIVHLYYLSLLRVTRKKNQIQFELDSNNRGISGGDKRRPGLHLPASDHNKPLEI